METPFLTACRLRSRTFLVYLFGQTLHWLLLTLAYWLAALMWMAQTRQTAGHRLAASTSHLRFSMGKLRSLLRPVSVAANGLKTKCIFSV